MRSPASYGRYGHLDRHEAKRLAREQADYLWRSSTAGTKVMLGQDTGR